MSKVNEKEKEGKCIKWFQAVVFSVQICVLARSGPQICISAFWKPRRKWKLGCHLYFQCPEAQQQTRSSGKMFLFQISAGDCPTPRVCGEKTVHNSTNNICHKERSQIDSSQMSAFVGVLLCFGLCLKNLTQCFQTSVDFMKNKT